MKGEAMNEARAKNMATRTPGPWKVFAGPNHEWKVKALERGGYFTICSVISFDEREANANFIVQACNSHDRLLEVCRALLFEYDRYGQNEWPDHGGLGKIITSARSVVARVDSQKGDERP
jgi:hypothetical protein